MPEASPEQAPGLYAAAQAIVTRLWRWTGGSVRVLGLEHLPDAGPGLILCNHQSYLDPILLQAHVRRPVYALAKSTSFSAPLTGPLMHRLCSFPVRRYQVDPQATRMALRHLAAGRLVAIYIEGERSWNGRLQEPRKGTVRLALKAGVPVIPCAISGTYEVMPRWQKKIRPGPITLRFLPPIPLPVLHGRVRREPLVEETALRIMAALAASLPAEIPATSGH
jgi:1-acyl-sn-glycerol-3-phosphate acyltransferase